MKGLKFIVSGVFFGIVMSKSEAISWYRIQEMFRFQSFHMYGIISTAVAIGIVGIYLIKKYQVKDVDGNVIVIPVKEKGWKKGIFGGTIFGMGWALTGACPGPMFVNLGQGYWAFLLIIFGALIGTYVYGILKDKLPH